MQNTYPYPPAAYGGPGIHPASSVESGSNTHGQSDRNPAGPSQHNIYANAAMTSHHQHQQERAGSDMRELVELRMDPPPFRARPKKRKTEELRDLPLTPHMSTDDEGVVKTKKTRQSQSCDACRARKVKCDRPPPGTATSEDLPTKDICSNCSHLGLVCTFEYKPKKRGPPNMYIRRLQEDSTSSTAPELVPPTVQDQALPRLAEPEWRTDDQWQPTLGSVSAPATPNAPTPNLSAPYTLAQASSSSQTPEPLVPDYSHLYPPYVLGVQYVPSPSRRATPIPHSTFSSPVQQKLAAEQPYLHHGHSPNNPFDVILPRSLLYHIIDLYYDYIYGLIPLLHRATLVRDLNAKREELPGQDEFIALVLVVVASTLVQLPRVYVPIPRKEVRELVFACRDKAKDFLFSDFQELTVFRTIIMYHYIYVEKVLGFDAVSRGTFAHLVGYVLTLRANEESSYALLDPIECAYRKRLFWLAYGADKSISAIEGTPLWFHQEECATVGFPEEIDMVAIRDDEYIISQGPHTQPAGVTPILSGFTYVSKIFKIMGIMLEAKRRDKLRQPKGLILQTRLNEMHDLLVQVMTVMDDCPLPLKLEYKSESVKSLSPGYYERVKSDIRNVFSNPQAYAEVNKDYYLVQQANIYVTQQMVRFMILQYRDDLLELQEQEMRMQTQTRSRRRSSVAKGSSGASGHPTENLSSSHVYMTDEKDEVVVDLLAILQKIPMPILAVNGHPVVNKVRFVASSLLDALENSPGSEGKNPTVSKQTRAQKAQNNLWHFLGILSEVEAYYSLNDDPPDISPTQPLVPVPVPNRGRSIA